MSLSVIDTIFADKFKPIDQSLLEENNIDDKGKPVNMKRVIKAGGVAYLLYRFDPDAEKEIFPLFKHSSNGGLKGLRKICDYFLFVKNSYDDLFVFLIELKQGSNCPKMQLEASECLINYILALSKLSNTPLDKSKIKIRKIGIRECDGIRKRKTKPGAGLEYDSKQFLQYYHETHFRIKELLT